MNPFDISGLNANQLAGGPAVNTALVVPSITWVNTWGTHIVLTDAGTYTSPDSFGKISIQVTDQSGNIIYGTITSASGTATIATTSTQFNQNDVLTIKATVVSTLGVTNDGLCNCSIATATGAVAFYNTGYTTTTD